MPRSKLNKLYNVFLKGLVTEAGELTYPENATSDELNCTISRKGNRGRRLGIDTEANGTTTALVSTTDPLVARSEFKWESVAGQAGVDFLCYQIGNRLYFFNLSFDSVSAGITSLNVDLVPFLRPGATNTERTPVSMDSGKGYLFVVGEHLEPFMVIYNRDTQTLSTERIYIQIRDFQGVDDGLANDEEPTTLSDLHHYNLRNQGWIDPKNTGSGGLSSTYYSYFGGVATYSAPPSTPITTYYNHANRYPPNSKQWFMAKDAQNDFDPQLLEKLFSGNNRAPRGHFVVNAFNVDRSAVSGVPNIPVEDNFERPRSVSFFAGRVWYATNSTVYFSQVLDDKRKAGFCYQEADPTSEEISDLIATDGGVIPIPEMSKALRLIPSGGGLLCFATNGIWMISGTSAGFTATDITVSKISPIGTDSPFSIVEAEGQFLWWSRVGIMGLSQKSGMFGPIEGAFDRTNISESTIQSLYNEIPYVSRPFVKGAFDSANNTVTWVHSDSEAGYKYNRLLNFDLSLGAFFPWKISSSLTTPWLCGIFNTPTINDIQIDYQRNDTLSFLKFISFSPTGAVAFNSFRNTSFADWGTEPFLSFLETGYELLGEAMRDKQITYLITYLKRTEQSFATETAETYNPTHRSSCFFQTKWDFASSAYSGKWTNKTQAYKLPLLFVPDDLSLDTGYPIVITKHKVRGNGKAIQFRFECEELDRDFDLLGWSAQFTGGTEV